MEKLFRRCIRAGYILPIPKLKRVKKELKRGKVLIVNCQVEKVKEKRRNLFFFSFVNFEEKGMLFQMLKLNCDLTRRLFGIWRD